MNTNAQLSRNLIREMTTIIDPADDYLTITAAEERMKINYAKAKKENDEAYTNLKCMCATLLCSCTRETVPRQLSLACWTRHGNHRRGHPMSQRWNSMPRD